MYGLLDIYLTNINLMINSWTSITLAECLFCYFVYFMYAFLDG